MKAVKTTQQTGQATVEETCRCFDLHRDAYYKINKRQEQRQAIESEVLKLVKEERIEQPRVGTRKLYKELKYTT